MAETMIPDAGVTRSVGALNEAGSPPQADKAKDVRPEKKPRTTREALIAFGISVVMVALGLAMWKWHAFYLSDLVRTLTGNEPIQRFRFKIDFIWCRPTGAILIAWGSIIIASSLAHLLRPSRRKV